MSRAFIFPGQGSQIVGMAKDFYDSFSAARETFQEVNDSLNYNLSNIIFNGPAEDLTLTANTQPALMTVSIAILRVIEQQSNKKVKSLCNYVAGHSLGEYSALCSANAIALRDTAKLLRIRGESMQSACQPGKGAMVACIGIEVTDLSDIIKDLQKYGECQIANDNVEGQIVVSGVVNAIDHLIEISKDVGFKAIKLNVSAPFHSSLIKAAEQPMRIALEQINISTPEIPLIANIAADITTNPDEIKANLIKQICGTVRWRETMHKFAELGVTELVEIGSGKVLSGLAKKSPHNFNAVNISNINDLDGFLKNL
jgi:[acyl-carrier-protein] S-malonyltransferase